jgi:hypothetical protein
LKILRLRPADGVAGGALSVTVRRASALEACFGPAIDLSPVTLQGGIGRDGRVCTPSNPNVPGVEPHLNRQAPPLVARHARQLVSSTADDAS